jgi:hypothetical protein
MSLIKEKMTFGRHETFSLRYGWLTKGFVALGQDTAIFTKPEEAMILWVLVKIWSQPFSIGYKL